MQKTTRFNLFYVTMAILGIILFHDLWMSYQSISPLAYSEFQTLVREGRVKEMVITADEIRGELKDPQPPNKRYFRTTRVENGLAEELQKYDVKFSGHIESRFFSTMLSWILPTLFLSLKPASPDFAASAPECSGLSA